MRNFKKIILSLFCFSLVFTLAFSVIVAPAFMNGSDYNDSRKRLELSGDLDYLICGASHALAAFNPKIIDEELNVNSYNLSSPSCYFDGRKELISKEVLRNKLSTVVLEVSFDAFARTSKKENGTGEPNVICKLDTTAEKFQYFIKNTDFFNNDYENVASIFLRYGLKAWKSYLSGNFNTIQEHKGYQPENTRDVTLKYSDIIKKYNCNDDEYVFENENIELFNDIVQTCKDNNVRLIVVVAPISVARIWRNHMDGFYNQLKDLCKTADCPVYDFNLLKTRFDILSDSTSFTDETHMSDRGAENFSKAFCNIISKVDVEEDVSDLFYSSYEEMKSDSPYMEYYLAHVNDTE